MEREGQVAVHMAGAGAVVVVVGLVAGQEARGRCGSCLYHNIEMRRYLRIGSKCRKCLLAKYLP